MATIKKACKGVSYPKSSSVSKKLGSPSKAKTGGSFPDLNKDGKVTKKDILIGKGVLPKTAKKGKMVKKAISKKAPMMAKAPMQAPSPMMKKGGKMTKKCAYGCK
jgi:hypothetical protein